MKTGVIFPSYADEVVWTAVAGAWSADYPLQNVSSLKEPSRVARASSAGSSRTISGVLPQNRQIRALALIGHLIPAGAVQWRAHFFSGTGSDPTANAADLLHDTGVQAFWPSASGPTDGYRSTRPYILPAVISARSFRIVINGAAGVTHQLSGIEIGGFWEWPGISPGRELGVRAEADRTDLVGGASYVQGKGTPIIARGSIDLLKMSVAQTTGLDFQAHTDKRRPFIWAEDFDDPATWARKCLLVRNEELPPSVGALYRHDRFQLRLVEHLR